MKKAKRIWLVWYTLSIIVVVVFFLSQPSSDKVCLQQYEREKGISYDGIVKAKYRDSTNHFDRTVELKDDRKILMEWDKSGLFEFIQTNDSIIKKAGGYEVKLYRNLNEYKFQIDFGCNNKD
ncbi:hypothetical protein [Sunxiuqinia dokdonensis]|nr:hypothetical protein [Sunxiuqinia dokdonensis]